MKYHLLLSSCTYASSSVSEGCRIEANELRQEMIKTLPKLRKKDASNCIQLYYLRDRSSMDELFKLLRPSDSIVVHSEGFPFYIGFLHTSPYNVTAFEFVELLVSQGMPNIELNIDLLSCNTATNFKGLNFACDTSTAFAVSGYTDVIVSGYTGYVVVKNNAKYTIAANDLNGKKLHCPLEHAKSSFKAGQVSASPLKLMCNFENIVFKWGSDYINKTQNNLRRVLVLEKSTF